MVFFVTFLYIALFADRNVALIFLKYYGLNVPKNQIDEDYTSGFKLRLHVFGTFEF